MFVFPFAFYRITLIIKINMNILLSSSGYHYHHNHHVDAGNFIFCIVDANRGKLSPNFVSIPFNIGITAR